MSETQQRELVEYTCVSCSTKTSATQNETRYVERMCYKCWMKAQGVDTDEL